MTDRDCGNSCASCCVLLIGFRLSWDQFTWVPCTTPHSDRMQMQELHLEAGGSAVLMSDDDDDDG